MKLDAVSIMQIISFLICITLMLSCIIYKYKKDSGNIDFELVNYLHKEKINYSLGMTVGEFTSYEKFQIWRFCVHF